MLVDSHCHLDFKDFSEDFEGVLERARAAGVGQMVTISTRLSTFPQVLAIAEAHDELVCSVGIHPHEAEAESDPEGDTARLIETAQHPKVVAIGETGLDYFYDHSPREIQQASFRSHIAAARETGLPLVVHTRDADDDMQAILTEEMKKGAYTGVLHCFSSSRALGLAAVELGLYVSLSGILTFKNAQELRDIAAEIPLERLLVETDAPYLAPVPKRGKRNEPAFVAHTASVLAELKGVSADELATITTENFYRLFSKAPRRTLAAA